VRERGHEEASEFPGTRTQVEHSRSGRESRESDGFGRPAWATSLVVLGPAIEAPGRHAPGFSQRARLYSGVPAQATFPVNRAGERPRSRVGRMTATVRSAELRSIAQGIADALPPTVEEVVLTGSVSRGVADDISDIEMLIVTQGELELGDCFSLAAAAALTGLDTWGQQGVPTKRVSGYRDGVPLELI